MLVFQSAVEEKAPEKLSLHNGNVLATVLRSDMTFTHTI